MKIFENYTGNAMLNNALMTIEALADIKAVSKITSDVILKLYNEPIRGFSLLELNQRFKSYTMIFSLNNPLVNPAKKTDNVGVKIFDGIMKSIIGMTENSGTKMCAISGLHYEKSFEDFYKEEVEKIKEVIKLKKLDAAKEKSELKNLDNTDFSINRCWFPLIGGLGSDAQSLPQAKYAINIHPICLVIMQFLPFSAFLYKGCVMLVDSINFEFTREFIKNNVEFIRNKIAVQKTDEAIENIKEFNKGHYLIRALEILETKSLHEDEYSDLNLWSFSNSGTGASCEIDRVPNHLIEKLIRLKSKPNCSAEFIRILQSNLSYSFLEFLNDAKEWWGLYPTKKYEGVTVAFFEGYLEVIGSGRKTAYSKYLAYLIEEYKSKSFEKYLSKTDAYADDNYKTDLYLVLIKATEEGKWNLDHHYNIMDNQNTFPIKNNTYQIHKIVHFYYHNKCLSNQLPVLIEDTTAIKLVMSWLIGLVQNDVNAKKSIKGLINPQEYDTVNYQQILLRSAEYYSLQEIFYALYDENGKLNRFGVNDLIRLFFLQKEQQLFERSNLNIPGDFSSYAFEKWFQQFHGFSLDYQAYYFDKYENKETKQQPINKFMRQVQSVSVLKNNFIFIKWFEEAVDSTNTFFKEKNKWSDNIFYNPEGEYSFNFSRFALQFSLLKQSLYNKTNQLINN